MSQSEPRSEVKVFQKVKGFQDIFGDVTPYWGRADAAVREVTALFAVEEIRLPVLEYTAVFNRGIGQTTDIVEKEMFTFTDRDRADKAGESLSLRPEGTAGVVRSYIENGMYNPPSLKKFFYSGNMFRRENPQKGRFRQFTQFGIEYIGSASAMVDADVINLLDRYFKIVGISEYLQLEINSVGCPVCRPSYHEILIEYFSDHKETLCEDCNRRLGKNPLRILDCKNRNCRPIINKAPHMIDHLCVDCGTHFEEVKSYLTQFEVSYKINPLMVRGLDYYVRTAFEMVTDKLGAASAIGAGGRYDGLVEILGGPAIPGVGFAIGLDRVVALLQMKEQLSTVKPTAFVVTFGGDTVNAGISILNSLRKAGVSAEIDYEIKSLKNQLKKADRSGAKYAIIVGVDELSKGMVTLRNMAKSEQELVDIAEIVTKIV